MLVSQTNNTKHCQEPLLQVSPNPRKILDPLLHDFWTVHDQLSAHNNISLFDQCLVIPKAFRKHELLVLHLAHQSVTNMQQEPMQPYIAPVWMQVLETLDIHAKNAMSILPPNVKNPQ